MRRLASAGALLLAPQVVHAQSTDEAFGRMQDAIGQAMAKLPDDERVASLFDNILAMQAKAARIPPADQADFARSLVHDAEMLEAALEAPGAERDAILADVAADIDVKQGTSASMGAETSFPGRVVVKVVTRKGAAVAPGYVIMLNPMRWRGSEPMFRLARLSPADGSVPPGRYEVTAYLGDRRVAAGIFRIGLAAEDKLDIELPVP